MQRGDRHTHSPKTWKSCLRFYKCTLYILVFSLELRTTVSEVTDPDVFAFYHEGEHACLGVQDGVLRMSSACGEPTQQWKWVSRGRVYNLGGTACLGQATGEGTVASLGMYTCDREPPRVRLSWHCKLVLESLGLYTPLGRDAANGSRDAVARESTEGQRWKLYNDDRDLCSKTYREIYTIQGNSHGRPCNLPFLYDGQWFHSCTSVGREDGHLWCATTYDYSKDERWGFCPVKSEGCETFWDIDPVTNNCYQFNFQSVLSWNEARASCRQQEADLLSITEVHEQTYVSGLLTSYSASLWIGLNDLDINGGWQWADSGPFKYLNWEPDQPSHAEEENCVVIRTETQGRWQTRDCSVALPYICKKKPNMGYDDTWQYDWVHSLKQGCSFGWTEFRDSCYKLNPRRLTWGEALKTCHRIGAKLVSIHSSGELDFIVRNLKKDVEELWIGLHDMNMQMNFEWSDHSRVTFTYWHPFEPNNFRNTQEDCVTMWGPEGRWNDSPCNLTLPSICSKGRTSDPDEVLDEKLDAMLDHSCKEGWHWYTPSCYSVRDEMVTYEQAKRACKDLGATLVTIDDRFEQAFLNRLLWGLPLGYYWIALHDQNNTGTFRWLSGGAVSYTNWGRDQPDFSKGGCVAMGTAAALGLWEVKGCNSTKAKYFCSISMDTPLTTEPPAAHTTPSPTGPCPQGWKTNRTMHHCYKVFHFPQLEQRLSWLQAHLFCRKHSAQLVSISSAGEEQFISQVLHETFGESEDHEQHWLWIGLNRRNPEDEGGWKWSDGLGYAYHNFGIRDSYERNMHDCAMIDLGTMQWMTMQCESQLDWVCKIPKGTVIKEPEEESSLKQWVRFQEAEYKFFDHRSTWFQALRICSWLDASLASVHTPEEQAFLTQTLRKMSKVEGQHWWVGLHTYENDGRFRWSDHSVLNYVSWAPGRPRPVGRDRKCVYITSSKDEWGDQKCSSDLPYICKRVNVTAIPPPTPHPPPQSGGCPYGWVPIFGKCFKLYGHQDTQRVTWAGAKAQCESQGASLAVVSDHVEQAFLTTLLPNISFHLWIGLSDRDVRFQWDNSSTPLSYTNWAPGEPAAHRDPLLTSTRVNCVAMLHGNPDKVTGMWASRGCEAEKHGYLCQKQKDPTLLPVSGSLPDLRAPLQFGDQTYQILSQRYDWMGALHMCNSRNASLAVVHDPYQAAYLTMILGFLERPAWIGLYNNGRRSFSWLGVDPLTYTDWWDGEPSNVVGCGHITTMGRWAVVPCSTKIYAICQSNTGASRDHEWSFSGRCPQAVGNWNWVPFRNNCYSFNLERLTMHQEAQDTCRKVGAQMLSILDETENSFVWEHIQTYEEQAHGAWLGMTVNSKGGGLLWPESTAVEYTNWEVQDTNLSMLSVKSCFWIQSNTGLWKPGSCKNRTHGMICKRQRGGEFSAILSEHDHLSTLVLILVTALVLVLLAVGVAYLYRRRTGGSRGSYEGARYSRTRASPVETAEKNILVSDMELNEQPE